MASLGTPVLWVTPTWASQSSLLLHHLIHHDDKPTADLGFPEAISSLGTSSHNDIMYTESGKQDGKMEFLPDMASRRTRKRTAPCILIVDVCAHFQQIIQELDPAFYKYISEKYISDATHLALLVLLPCKKSNRGLVVTKGDFKHHRTVCSLITCFHDHMVLCQLGVHLKISHLLWEPPKRSQRPKKEQRHWDDSKSWT